jgi:hypothetical protein
VCACVLYIPMYVYLNGYWEKNKVPKVVLGASSAPHHMLYPSLYAAFDLLVLKSCDMPLAHISNMLRSNLGLARVKIIEAF